MSGRKIEEGREGDGEEGGRLWFRRGGSLVMVAKVGCMRWS